MTARQAREYLDDFVAELPTSRNRLAQMLAAADVDPRLADDLSPGSLDSLWDVATRAWGLSWQSDYIPGRAPADPPLRCPTLAALGPLDGLPSWFRHGPTHYLRFSTGTLWVIDVIGRHLGQCLIAAGTDLGWVPGPGPPGHHSHEKNRPLVGNGTSWVSPLAQVSGLVHGQITGQLPPEAPGTLGAAFARSSEVLGRAPEGEDPVTVEDLVDVGSLRVRPLDHADAGDRGPLQLGFHYEVWLGDEARLLYDDEAPVGLGDLLAAHPAVLAVDCQDREVLHVKAPGLAVDGVLDAVAEALRDPRLRPAEG